MAHRSRSRVVLVDEVELEAKLLVRALADRGYSRLVHARDEERAMTALEGDGPSILVVDADVQGSKSLDLVRRVRSRTHGAYVYLIVLASRGQAQRSREAFDAGADDYLTKPLDLDDLAYRLRAADRIMQLENALRVQAGELDGALRAIDANAAQRALARAATKTTTADSPLDDLFEAVSWEAMRDILADGLASFFGSPFSTSTIQQGPKAAIVADVAMTESVRQLELGVSVVVDGAAAQALAAALLGEEADIESSCALILEAANVLMGVLKAAYSDRGYGFTGGLPNSTDANAARESFDTFAARQRFIFSMGDAATLEVWVRVSEKKNVAVKGSELREGMVIADDVRDERGMLLVRGGARLTETTAERLSRLLGAREVTVSMLG